MNNLKERITNHPFFRNMKQEHLALLTKHAREMSFKTDDVLFHEGEPANQFYLIESGCVALEAYQLANGTVPIQDLRVGEVLGWSWLFAPFTWHFQARAVEPVNAIVLSGAHLLIAAEEDHEFGYELMKRVAQV